MAVRLYHVNFHTVGNKPVFLDEEVDASLRAILREAIRSHHIVCLALEVMPTHVHLILVDFPDQGRGTIVQLIKGVSARRFLDAHSAFREDLGDHLWEEGYSWREITSHLQFYETLRYVRENRRKGGLDD